MRARYDAESMTRRARLIVEMVCLFGLLPMVLLWIEPKRSLLPILWVFMASILVVLLRDRSFDRKQLWNARAFKDHWRPILLRFAVLAPILALATWLLTPELFFFLPREKPWLILMIICLYPIFSVYPQGIVYRAFLLHRYDGLMSSTAMKIGVAAVCFGFLHILFRNPVAPLVTLVGGAMFAWTHHRSRSLFVSSFEHALYGLWLMSSGWGAFLYPGTVNMAMGFLMGEPIE